MDTTTPRSVRLFAEACFAAWQDRDAVALRSLMADDCTFRGPLGSADDAEACVAGLVGMAAVLDRVELRAMVADSSSSPTATPACPSPRPRTPGPTAYAPWCCSTPTSHRTATPRGR
ncbi:nuclear transport factor 2 family protein [Nocardioides litoris]|uniref:nuclear transport factor 2 family protein n=1 Tax=Nocardioides litoris TaxID=1926648 RepID=UPI00111CCC91|nr:nuclear transport factor 2 family protein [Nocardioides litoris]